MTKTKLTIILGAFLSLFLSASPAFADSERHVASDRAEWGGRDISYYSSDQEDGATVYGFHRERSGATWYYYSIPDDNNYTDEDRIIVPFNSRFENINKVSIPAKTCQGYGGFWVLLRNEYTTTAGQGDMQDGVLTGNPAGAVHLSDIYYNGNGISFLGTRNHIKYFNASSFGEKSPSGESKDGVTFVSYGNFDAVKTDFDKYSGTSAVPDGYGWDNDSPLSYFCSGTKTPVDTRDFETFSTVTIFRPNENSLEDSFTSAPVISSNLNNTSYLGSSTSGINVPVGATFRIRFNHYLGTYIEDNNTVSGNGPSYSITRSGSRIGSGSLSPSEMNAGFRDNPLMTISGVPYHNAIVSVDYNNGDYLTMGTSSLSICETIEFGRLSYTIGSTEEHTINLDDDGNMTSTACIYVHPVNPNTDTAVVQSCEDGGDGYYTYKGSSGFKYGGNSGLQAFGNTVATVGLSKNGVLVDKTSAGPRNVDAKNDPSYREIYEGSTAQTYAKPGDIIQFSYAICFGVADVQYNSGKNAEAAIWASNTYYEKGKVDYGARPVGRTFLDYYKYNSGKFDSAAYFAVYNEAIGDGSALLFGRLKSLLGNFVFPNYSNIRVNNVDQAFSYTEKAPEEEEEDLVDEEEETEEQEESDGSEEITDYTNEAERWTDSGDLDFVTYDASKRQLAFASPDNINNKSNTTTITLGQPDNYSCALYYSGYGNNVLGYQIPGLQYANADTCLSSVAEDKLKSYSSAVGSTIKQTLAYTYNTIWPKKLNGVDYSGGKPDSPDCTTGDTRFIDIQNLLTAKRLYESAYNAYVRGNRSIGSDCLVGTGTTAKKTASVIIPYNYNTNISGEVTSIVSENNPDVDNVVYPGDEMTLHGHIDILARENPLTSDRNGDSLVPYATITPYNTKVVAIELLIRDTVDINEKVSNDKTIGDVLNFATGETVENASACRYYSKYLGDNLADCHDSILKGYTALGSDENRAVGNNTSNPAGEMNYYDGTITKNVPDAEAGYKYCMVFATNHGDSHNNPNGQLYTLDELRRITGNSSLTEDEARSDPRFAANKWSVSNSASAYVPNSWKYTAATCRTIAKKPSFSVWNSGVFSGGTIGGTYGLKGVNSKIGQKTEEEWDSLVERVRTVTKQDECGYLTNASERRACEAEVDAEIDESVKLRNVIPTPTYFGSWAEYYVIAGDTSEGFASANGLGYSTRRIDWVVKDGEQLHYYENPTKERAYEWEGSKTEKGTEHSTVRTMVAYGKTITVDEDCVLSKLTIGNVTCETGAVGSYGSNVNVNLRDNVVKLYQNGDPLEVTVTRTSKYSDGYTLNKLNNDMTDYYYLRTAGSYTLDQNIVRTYGTMDNDPNQEHGTLVIQVDGHLDIMRNICLETSAGSSCETAGSSTATDRELNTFNASDVYNIDPYGLYERVKNLNNLSLTERNNLEVDANSLDHIPQVIIIAESISIGQDVTQLDAWLITYSSDTYGTYDGGYINTCKEYVNAQTSANDCWKTLKVNGPVLTTSLLLNRTGGSWSGLTGDVGNPIYNDIKTQIVNWKNGVKQYLIDNSNLHECKRGEDGYDGCINAKVEEYFKDALKAFGPDGDANAEAKRQVYKSVDAYYGNSSSFSAGRGISRDLTCDGAVSPAEIFDLHPLTIYWVYGQAQKNMTPIITLLQELAPRY